MWSYRRCFNQNLGAIIHENSVQNCVNNFAVLNRKKHDYIAGFMECVTKVLKRLLKNENKKNENEKSSSKEHLL